MINSKTFPRVLRSAMAATVPILSPPGFFSGIVIDFLKYLGWYLGHKFQFIASALGGLIMWCNCMTTSSLTSSELGGFPDF